MVAKPTVSVPSSKVKVAIAQVLKDEGYIDGFKVSTEGGKAELEIALKYYAGRPVIERISASAALACAFTGQRGNSPSPKWTGCCHRNDTQGCYD